MCFRAQDESFQTWQNASSPLTSDLTRDNRTFNTGTLGKSLKMRILLTHTLKIEVLCPDNQFSECVKTLSIQSCQAFSCVVEKKKQVRAHSVSTKNNILLTLQWRQGTDGGVSAGLGASHLDAGVRVLKTQNTSVGVWKSGLIFRGLC